jgi:hypothetical protein
LRSMFYSLPPLFREMSATHPQVSYRLYETYRTTQALV